MSRSDFLKTLGFALLAESIIFSGCGKFEGDNNDRLKTGQFEVKVKPDRNNRISFQAITKKITIDWGDGKVDTFSPNRINREFIHEYPDQSAQTVSIVTESMTEFFSHYLPIIIGNIGKGNFRELRFGNCFELEKLYCNNKQLNVLDVKNAVASLKILNSQGNLLTSLDVGGASKMTDLFCNSNQLTELNLSSCTALTKLYCQYNQLAELNLSSCTALAELWCNDNQLSTSALNAIFYSLPDRTQDSVGEVFFWENPGTAFCDVSILESKNWMWHKF